MPGSSFDEQAKPQRSAPDPSLAKDFAAVAAAQAQAAAIAQASANQTASNQSPQAMSTSPTTKPPMAPPPEERAELREDDGDKVEELDDTDRAVLEDLLPEDERARRFNNKERRKVIEARLKELNPADLDDHFEYRQVVDTGNVVFIFRSPSHGEVEAVYRIIISEGAQGLYGINKLSAMLTCLGTVSIAGKDLPHHLNSNGVFERTLFDNKYAFYSRFPHGLIEDSRVQFSWFDDRVAKMLSGGNLGNG